MAVYKFTKELKRFDIDKTTEERHLSGDNPLNKLDRNYLHKIQERFHELGFGYMVGNINGCFNFKLYATILSFQAQSKKATRRILNLNEDKIYQKKVNVTFIGEINGVFDEHTADELNIWLENNYRNSCEVPLIKWGKTWMRESMAEKLDNIKNHLFFNKSIFPSDNIACFRSPSNTTISTGMKKKSLHLAALAFDLDEWRGMRNPEKDFYYISDKDGKYWELFLKTENQDIPVSEKQFIFYNIDDKEYYSKLLKGRFINLTDILSLNGFEPIGRKKGWETEYYLTEWWHFQFQDIDENKWKTEMCNIGYIEYYLAEFGYIN
ncbi:MAG: hypothetical protein ACK5M1_07180 [Xanthomarina gelatinilytica]|uniref:hypothetical protein n=1 Tax=Xanthomarina gelatinilytica TaxID=1137281 RepID=UPI003A878A51